MTDDHDLAITVAHRYRHPAEAVFDAWLDPRLARRFLFATETGEIVRCEVDPRVGGRFVVTDRRPDGEVEHVGTYRAIERPRRLEFAFGIPALSPSQDVVTLEIAPEATGGCRLQLTARMEPEWRDYLARARAGWRQVLAGLDAALG